MSLHDLTRHIRNFINMTHRQNRLIMDHDRWNQMCSALDVIGDTELALDAYLQYHIPDDQGAKYLYAYGVLQSLNVQQDAVKHLSESLRIRYQLDQDDEDSLKEIREIRNRSIGHPTEFKRSGVRSFHFISRCSLRKEGFQLLSACHPKDKFEDVDIPSCIAQQRGIVASVLKQINDGLKQDEKNYRKRFKQRSMRDIFESASYYVEKVWEGSRSREQYEFATMHVGLLLEIITKFETALCERNKQADHIQQEFNDAKYILKQLEDFFTGDNAHLWEQDIDIFLDALRAKFEFMEKCSAEIDAEMNEDA